MKFFLILLLTTLLPNTLFSRHQHTPDFIVILDPAGDAQTPGRIIGNHFERGLTLACVEHLKNQLSELFPEIRVMLTRFPGEAPTPFKNASFTNKMGGNLYISLHMYQQQEMRTIDFYIFGTGTPPAPSYEKNRLTLTPVHLVHQKASSLSQRYAQQMYDELMVSCEKNTQLHAPLTIPFAPLKGIGCPAFALEVSVKNQRDALTFVDTLANALAPVINQALATQEYS